MPPNFIAVSSSSIDGYRYLVERALLLIAFRRGVIYGYDDVEESVVTDLANASSKGRYFAAAIRDRYATRKLEENEISILQGGEGTSMLPQKDTGKTGKVRREALLQRYPMLDAMY